MKKTLLFFALSFIGFNSFAQINDGQWMVGGTGAFSTAKTSANGATTTSNFTLAPNAGYFIMDKLAAGLRTSLSTMKISDANKNSIFSLTPFVRYYLLNKNENVNLFADASWGFSHDKTKVAGITNKSNGSSYFIQAGPAVFLTPNVALELTVGYGRSKYKDVDESTGNFRTGVGFQIHLGDSNKK